MTVKAVDEKTTTTKNPGFTQFPELEQFRTHQSIQEKMAMGAELTPEELQQKKRMVESSRRIEASESNYVERITMLGKQKGAKGYAWRGVRVAGGALVTLAIGKGISKAYSLIKDWRA